MTKNTTPTPASTSEAGSKDRQSKRGVLIGAAAICFSILLAPLIGNAGGAGVMDTGFCIVSQYGEEEIRGHAGGTLCDTVFGEGSEGGGGEEIPEEEIPEEESPEIEGPDLPGVVNPAYHAPVISACTAPRSLGSHNRSLIVEWSVPAEMDDFAYDDLEYYILEDGVYSLLTASYMLDGISTSGDVLNGYSTTFSGSLLFMDYGGEKELGFRFTDGESVSPPSSVTGTFTVTGIGNSCTFTNG